MNYPIKFGPILKQKIWGGDKISTLLNKETKLTNVGESWEISGVPGSVSVIANGTQKGLTLKELIGKYKSKIVGENIYQQFKDDFPLLIKFIDAKTDLSVQLHPNDDLAKERHHSFGKTEMWYVLDADPGSKLNIGFKKTITKAEYQQSLDQGTLLNLLHFEEVDRGDSVFINTGKVHAIGGGVLLAEIQQTSDITYRIYDWDRVDDEGNARELHTELALDAIDFEKKDDYKLTYDHKKNASSQIASCAYFTTNKIFVEGTFIKDYSQLDSFVIFMCVEGKATVKTTEAETSIQFGETVLIPACSTDVTITADSCELLEVYIKA